MCMDSNCRCSARAHTHTHTPGRAAELQLTPLVSQEAIASGAQLPEDQTWQAQQNEVRGVPGNPGCVVYYKARLVTHMAWLTPSTSVPDREQKSQEELGAWAQWLNFIPSPIARCYAFATFERAQMPGAPRNTFTHAQSYRQVTLGIQAMLIRHFMGRLPLSMGIIIFPETV